MSTELRIRNQARDIFNRALSSAWRSVQLYDPSIWLTRDPEAEEKMRRDADIAHALGYRDRLIAGRRWTLTPRHEADPRSDLAVAVGTELLKGIKKFTEARMLMANAYFPGQVFMRIHCQPRHLLLGDGRMRTWMVPTRLEHMDKRMYRIKPRRDEQTQTIHAHWERWHVGPDKWLPEDGLDALQTIEHTYLDDVGTLGYGRALREGLGWCWYAKTHVWQESLQAVERFAQGLLVAKVDGARDAATNKTNQTVVQDFVDELEDMRARHVLVMDRGDDLEVTSGSGEGWQLLDTIEQKLATKIVTLVLGANLPTTATEGGSYALGGIQENSTEALVQADREMLEETLTDDLLGYVWFKNHPNLVELGIQEQKPRFSITQTKREDPNQTADVASKLHGMGVDLDAADLYERTGFKKPEPGAEIIAGREATQPVLPFGPGGFGQ